MGNIVVMSTLETWLRYKYLTLLESFPGDIMHSNSLLNSTIINPYFSELQLIPKKILRKVTFIHLSQIISLKYGHGIQILQDIF